jgi:hypothetical protein
MKTETQILENNLVLTTRDLKRIVFNKLTPIKTAEKIVELYESQTRIIFDYGDIKTNKSWGESYDITGKIGMSKGAYDLRYPILIHNSRSIGGGTILTNCIISIKESKGKRLIFNN